MTTAEPEEQGTTAPIELPESQDSQPPAAQRSRSSPSEPPSTKPASPTRRSSSRSAASSGAASAEPVALADGSSAAAEVAPGEASITEAHPLVARAVSPAQQEVLFVPLAVSIGDGFKFGCGFFLALVLAMLVGFVLLAALFVLTTLIGLNLPFSR